MKIEAVKAWGVEDEGTLTIETFSWGTKPLPDVDLLDGETAVPVRIVREADWRKVMRVVKDAEKWVKDNFYAQKGHMVWPLELQKSVDALFGKEKP